MLFPAFNRPSGRIALRFPDRRLTYFDVREAATAIAQRVGGAERVGVWAVPAPETCVAVVGALLAGVAAVPINPKAGERELGHILADSDPAHMLCPPGTDLPAPAA